MRKVPKRKVAIVGAFTTPCRGRWLSKTIWELAQWAVSGALQDARLKMDRVEAGAIGLYNDIFARQAIPESSFLGHMGLAFKPLPRVTNGGATGIYTFGVAFDMVASGRYDIVLCIGAEKATDCYDFMSETQTPEVVQTIAWSWDPLFERDQGATAADSYAEVILSYMDQYPNDLKMAVRGEILRILCEQAKNNPNAQRRDEIVTPERVENSPWIIEPAFKKLETCVYTEGACCLIFAAEGVAEEICKDAGQPPIWIEGVGFANEPYWWGIKHPHKLPGRIESDHLAAKAAYEMAGVGPKDINVVELHDAFLPQLEITMAEMGFVPPGQADDLIEKKIMAPHGKLLINPSGGLIYGGHFVGGSNMFSAWSARRELIRRGLDYALIHGTGASSAQYGGAAVLKRGVV
jgi:acetyl-CoA C-acetyltransferase